MKQPGNLISVPYPVPPEVKALGQPQQIFLPGIECSKLGRITAAVFAILALGFLGIGGMLLYCAVHPFGSSPPPPVVCWIVGGVLSLLGCASALGSYHLSSGAGDNKQAYLVYDKCLVELFPRRHRVIPWEKIATSTSNTPVLKMFRFSTGTGKDIAFDSSLPKHDELAGLIDLRRGTPARSGVAARVHPTASADQRAALSKTFAKPADTGAQKTPTEQDDKLSMESTILSKPVLLEPMGALVEALMQTAPEHYAMLHLVVETRKANGKTSVLFTHGSPVLPEEYSTLVPYSVAKASYAITDSLLKIDGHFPGFEIVLRKTAPGNWNVQFHGLNEPGPQWSNLPRCPLRVVGYGLSLTPVMGMIFRWARNTNPSGIIASARRGDAKAPAKQVQLILSNPGHKLALGQGVAKAEEIIEVSEGPETSKWIIETPIFRMAWPNGLDLRPPLASKTRFDLVAPDNTLIFVQGPVPEEPRLLDTMPVEGQKVVGRGRTTAGHEWIELDYEVQGNKWRQRHYAHRNSPKMLFVVTAQCLQSASAKIFQASEEVADSLSRSAN
jgi:hypothetical protein